MVFLCFVVVVVFGGRGVLLLLLLPPPPFSSFLGGGGGGRGWRGVCVSVLFLFCYVSVFILAFKWTDIKMHSIANRFVTKPEV